MQIQTQTSSKNPVFPKAQTYIFVSRREAACRFGMWRQERAEQELLHCIGNVSVKDDTWQKQKIHYVWMIETRLLCVSNSQLTVLSII